MSHIHKNFLKKKLFHFINRYTIKFSVEMFTLLYAFPNISRIVVRCNDVTVIFQNHCETP